MIIYDEGYLWALSNQQYTESLSKDYANDTARENLLPKTFKDLFRSLVCAYEILNPEVILKWFLAF